MRYQELREARGHLEQAIVYLSKSLTDPFQEHEALNILGLAYLSVKAELTRPEAFNLDGTAREIRFYTGSQQGVPAVGTFPPENTDQVSSLSRQVRRALARALGFNQLSFPRQTQIDEADHEFVQRNEFSKQCGLCGKERKIETKIGRSPMLPRAERRKLALKARIQKPQPIPAQETK